MINRRQRQFLFNAARATESHYTWANFDILVNYIVIDKYRVDIFGFSDTYQFLKMRLAELMKFEKTASELEAHLILWARLMLS